MTPSGKLLEWWRESCRQQFGRRVSYRADGRVEVYKRLIEKHGYQPVMRHVALIEQALDRVEMEERERSQRAAVARNC